MFFLFITLLFLSGALVLVLSRRAKSAEETLTLGYADLFTVLMTGIVAVSFVSIVLLEFGRFSAEGVLLVLAVIVVLLLFLVLRSARLRPLPAIKLHLPLGAPQLAMLAILLVAALLRFPPSNYLLGGQDQGLYVNIGNNIARTGKVFIIDHAGDTFRGEPWLKDEYERANYKGGVVVEGRYEGTFVPGVYIKDSGKGELVPQFYHLMPVWFALSNNLLGAERSTYPLFIFSMLGIISLYLLARVVFESEAVALLSAFLLAVSPLHTYFSKLPVTETTAALFFTAALYYLLKSDFKDRFALALSASAFGCLFFTRITGFLFLPTLVLIVFYLRIFVRDRAVSKNLAWFLFVVLGAYLYSVLHGLALSFPYSFDIYTINIGSKAVTAFLAGLLILISVLVVVDRYLPRPLRKLWYSIARRKKAVSAGVIALILILVGFRAYALAFTDALMGTDLDYKWEVAGSGLRALDVVNLVALAKLVTPIGLVLFIGGLYVLMKRSFYNKKRFVFVFFTINFFVVYTVVKYTTPYLYYYARYFVSELLPLMTIVTAFALVTLSVRFRQRGLWRYAASVLAAAMVLHSLYFSCYLTRHTDFEGLYDTLDAVRGELKGRPLLLMDRAYLPDLVLNLVTPMELTFGVETFRFYSGELGEEGLKDLVELLSSTGYDVYVFTLKRSGLDYEFLNLEEVVPMTYTLLKNKYTDWLPWKYRKDEYKIWLYSAPVDIVSYN